MDQKKSKSNIILGLKNKLTVLEEELKNDVSLPIVASFGFLIALLWRDAVKSTLDEFVLRAGLLEKAYVYDIFSAIIITIILSIVMVVLTNFSRKKKRKRIREEVRLLKKKDDKLSKKKGIEE